MSLLNLLEFLFKKPKSQSNKIKFFINYYLIFLSIFLLLLFICLKYINSNSFNYKNENHERISLDLKNIQTIVLDSNYDDLAEEKNKNCSFWDCFNVYRCGQKNHEKIAVYVYPFKNYVDEDDKKADNLSKEFYTILKTIIESPYYTSNPNEACILIPSIDTLNLINADKELVSRALASLPNWDNGENHLIFNMVGNNLDEFTTANSLVASANFDTWTYRIGFDLSLPFYSPYLYSINYYDILNKNDDRPFTLIASGLTLSTLNINILQEIAFNQQKILFIKNCGKNYYQAEFSTQTNTNENNGNYYCSYPSKDIYEYPNLLELGDYCLVSLDGKLNHFSLLEAISSNCIPVLIDNIRALPFNEIIDWKLATVTINERNLEMILEILNKISLERKNELRAQMKWLYENYFHSLQNIIETMLEELNDRIQPHIAKNYLDWNIPKLRKSTQNPLFLPLIAPKSQGFTAVILTYDRIESLMTLVQKLAVVSSLQKILIVWNNQKKAPPHLAMFQKINKPLKIIQTKENKLSNRFYPYEEIETEAILTIDDDIIMLTADELDFGYEVWREFPDRIVGFPSRTHVWDNVTARWKYESEWTNSISMVLTGAAFHHKFWSHMYTTAMPGKIKEWVDEKMNCEDIAMNFLVANITNKPPIKVAPRKKFKCPECINSEMLSADLNHMMERSACIDRFAKIYGSMPLKTVEFRADPVLYKDNFPEKLKRFNDIGSL